VATDVPGKSAVRSKKKPEQLAQALEGILGPHQRVMLASQLRHIDFFDQEIARLDREIEERMRSFVQSHGRFSVKFKA
jgi:transposase